MAENIKSGKYYRVFNGESWDRMHFVTDASSVLTNDGKTVETNLAAINENLDVVNNNLGGLRFGYDGDNDVYGYYKADDSFVPFRNFYGVVDLGTERTIDITSIVGAKNIGKYTEDDFICMALASVTGKIWIPYPEFLTWVGTEKKTALVKTYDPTTGVLNLTGGTYNVTATMIAAAEGKSYSTKNNSPVQSYLILKTPPIESNS